MIGMAASMFTAAIATLNLDDWKVYADRVRKAMRFSGHSDQDAYLAMDVNHSQFRRQMLGQEKLTHPDTMRLSPEFHSWFGLLLVQDYGMPSEVSGAQQVASWLQDGRYALPEEKR
jgi:hypothetical protein